MRATEFASAAEQARELGLTVGDTIQGREKVGDGWHEARITLLWIGSTHTAWIVSGRSSRPREGGAWSSPHEATNWDLGCREWERIETPPEHAALLPASASTANRAAGLLEQTTPPPLPPDCIDPEYQGEDRELLEAFQRAWWAESGSSDKCHMAGIRAVLALRPTVAAVRAADAAISNEDLEAEFRAWWKAQGWDEDLAALHVVLTHVAWGRHLLSRGGL